MWVVWASCLFFGGGHAKSGQIVFLEIEAAVVGLFWEARPEVDNLLCFSKSRRGSKNRAEKEKVAVEHKLVLKVRFLVCSFVGFV